MPDYIQHLNGRIINKWISVDPSIVNGLSNILQVTRQEAESVTKFHIVDNGVLREMTAIEKDTLIAEENQAIIDTENKRISDLDLKINSLNGITLTNIDKIIDKIGSLQDAKIFLKKLCRYIIKFTAR